MVHRVLIIEDDVQIVDLLKIHLNDLNCDVKFETDGNHGYLVAKQEEFDLIILDIMLPGMNGLDVCRNLRADKIKTPILMLTSKSEEIDKILGLETGADDYLTKPFSVREFIARVKAIFRRTEMYKSSISENENQIFRCENLEVDISKRKVLLDDKRIELTPKEFDLLALMIQNPGKSYSRDRLLQLVWGYEFEGYEHTVNSHINRLRSKIEPEISQPTFIRTTWGVGYRFMD